MYEVRKEKRESRTLIPSFHILSTMGIFSYTEEEGRLA